MFLTFEVEDDYYERLTALCEQRDISVEQVVRRGIRMQAYFLHHPEKRPAAIQTTGSGTAVNELYW